MLSHPFVCVLCFHVDDVELAFKGPLPTDPSQQLCTYCQTGQWHGAFEYRAYNPQYDRVCNQPDGLGLG